MELAASLDHLSLDDLTDLVTFLQQPYDPADVSGLDLAFCALPHGSTQAVVAEILGKVPHVVDLSADFRLKDPDLYPQWYGEVHHHPELLAEAVYGLPEFFRTEIADARLVAALS